MMSKSDSKISGFGDWVPDFFNIQYKYAEDTKK